MTPNRTHGSRQLRQFVVLLLSVLAALAAPAIAADAQGDDGLDIIINQIDLSEYPRMKLFVTVTSDDGTPVGGLGNADFTVLEDGKPMTLTEVNSVSDPGAASFPIKIALAIDTSSSMRGEAIENAKSAAAEFVDGLEPKDKVALYAFNDTVTELLPFTNNKEVIKERIGLLEAGGGTALYEAVYQVAEAASQEEGRRAFVVLTDGWNDTALPRSLDEALARAREAQAPGYVLGFGSAYDQALTRVANETDGRYLRKPSARDVRSLFAELTGLLSSQYVLSYDTSLTADSKSHDFMARVSRDSRSAEVTKSIVITVGDLPDRGQPTVTQAAEPTPLPTEVTLPLDTCPNACLERNSDGTCGCCDVNGDGKCDATTVIPPWIWLLIPLLFLMLALLGAFVYSRRGRPDTGQGHTQVWVEQDATDYVLPESEPPVQEVQPTHHETTLLAAPGSPLAWLVITSGPMSGSELRLRPGATQIGRGSDNDIVIDDEAASHYQAKIRYEGGDYILFDMGATNPTEVNGKEIARQTLHDHDRIKIGRTELIFLVVSPKSD